jgi:hypothetical protein
VKREVCWKEEKGELFEGEGEEGLTKCFQRRKFSSVLLRQLEIGRLPVIQQQEYFRVPLHNPCIVSSSALDFYIYLLS